MNVAENKYSPQLELECVHVAVEPIRTLQTFGKYNIHAVLADCSGEERKLNTGRVNKQEQIEA